MAQIAPPTTPSPSPPSSPSQLSTPHDQPTSISSSLKRERSSTPSREAVTVARDDGGTPMEPEAKKMRIGFLLGEEERSEPYPGQGEGEMERLARECEREEEGLSVRVMRGVEMVKSEQEQQSNAEAEIGVAEALFKEEEGQEIKPDADVKEEIKPSLPSTPPPPPARPPVFHLPSPSSPPPADANFSWCTWISLWDSQRFFEISPQQLCYEFCLPEREKQAQGRSQQYDLHQIFALAEFLYDGTAARSSLDAYVKCKTEISDARCKAWKGDSPLCLCEEGHGHKIPYARPPSPVERRGSLVKNEEGKPELGAGQESKPRVGGRPLVDCGPLV